MLYYTVSTPDLVWFDSCSAERNGCMRKFVMAAALVVALLGVFGVEVGRAATTTAASANVAMLAAGPMALCGGSASTPC